MIKVYYFKIQNLLSLTQWHLYFSYLPPLEQRRNERIRVWKNKYAHLFSRLLLMTALQNLGYPRDILKQIDFRSFRKPTLGPEVDFNISHSSDFIVCAVCKGFPVGIDVEFHNPLNIEDFQCIFSKNEWNFLKSKSNRISTFYWLWTRKESILKASGKGISEELSKVDVLNSSVEFDNLKLRLYDLFIDENYHLSLSSTLEDAEICMIPCRF